MDQLNYERHADLRKYLLHNVEMTGVKLGAGSFGSVEEVTMADTVCAGKIWHETLLDPKNEGVDNMVQRFIHECELMSQVHHPNIVQFMGICFKGSPYPMLVMERMHMSLDSLLETRKNIPLGLKLQVLLDVTRGLVHLHDNMQPPIVHRDLTTRNVLLVESLKAKIADLGNARMIEPGKLSKTLSNSPGTHVYMPPETGGDKPSYSSSLDIFSFGHLALYTVTQVFPGNLMPATYTDPVSHCLFPRSELERRHQYLGILHAKIGKGHALTVMIEQCLSNAPALRPTASVLLNNIKGLRKKYEDEFDAIQGKTKLALLDEMQKETNREQAPIIDESIYQVQTGVPDVLQIHTMVGPVLHRQRGWKEYVFRITDTVLKYGKPNKDKDINSIPLSSITSVNAVKSSQFTDTALFYFEIHFKGNGSPWLLRTYTKNKRMSWMKSLVSKVSQPVAEVHTESYTSFDYAMHTTTSRCEPDEYDILPSAYDSLPTSPAAQPATKRELPEIPSNENADDDDDDDDSDLYSRIIDPVPSLLPSGSCSDPLVVTSPPPTPTDGNDYECFPEEYPTARLPGEAPAPVRTEKSQACDNELYEDTESMVQGIQKSPVGNDGDEFLYEDIVGVSLSPVSHCPTLPLPTEAPPSSILQPPPLPTAPRPQQPSPKATPSIPPLPTAPRPQQPSPKATPSIPPLLTAPRPKQSSPKATPSIPQPPPLPQTTTHPPEEIKSPEPSTTGRVSETEDYISQPSDDHYEDMEPGVSENESDSDDEGDIYTQPDFKGTNSSAEEETDGGEGGYASIDDIDSTKDYQVEEGGYTCIPDVPAALEETYTSIDDAMKNGTEICENFKNIGIRRNSVASATLSKSAPKRQARSMSLTSLEEKQQQMQELQQQQQKQEWLQQQQQKQELQQPQQDASSEQLVILVQRMQEMQQMLVQLQSTAHSPDATPHPEPQLLPSPLPPLPPSSHPKLGSTPDNATEQLPTLQANKSRGGEKSEVTLNPPAKTGYTAKAAVTVRTTKRKMKEVLRELLRSTGPNKGLITDDQGDAPKLSRASTKNEVVFEDITSTNALFISKKNISQKELLRSGNFGDVYYAKLHRGGKKIEVAIKTIKNLEDPRDKLDFEREQNIMHQMAHPNIVQLYGLLRDEDPPSMVLEYMPNGDLKIFLKQNKRPITKLTKYMLDVSMGMDYISKMGLVHRDLAARNVMLGKDEICKVGDFGLLRQMKGAKKNDVIYYASASDTPIPIRWMAPESLDFTKKHFSTASDVWSFGIVQWEMMNPRGKPYKDMSNEEVRQRVIFNDLRLPIPSDYPPDIQSIMKACWNKDPSKRPSFCQISYVLTNLIFGEE